MKLTESRLREMVRSILREDVGIEAGMKFEIEDNLAEMLKQPIADMAPQLEVELSEDNINEIAERAARNAIASVSDEIINAIISFYRYRSK